MPIWASIYFFGFVTIALTSAINDAKEALVFGIFEFISDISLIVVALSYWYEFIRVSFQSLLLPLYIVGSVLFIFHAGRSFRCQVNIFTVDGSSGKKLIAGILGTSIIVLIHAPLLFWGFKASVQNVYTGT
jgi:hypothetical protein